MADVKCDTSCAPLKTAEAAAVAEGGATAPPATVASCAAVEEASAGPPGPVTEDTDPGLTPLRREQTYMMGTADVRINTVRWVPPSPGDGEADRPVAAVLFVHGYGHYTALSYDWCASLLWHRHRIAAFALDNIGHGKSEGLAGFVPSFDNLVNDVLNYAAVVREKYLTEHQPLFGYGESLGGGILLHAALEEPDAFAGLTLFAPMVGIDPDMRPSYALEKVAELLAWIIPTAPLAPVKDLVPFCSRDPAMLPLIRGDPHRYSGGMRIGTAMQLRDALSRLESDAASVTTPLFIVHGTADKITSCPASQRLFYSAATQDKTFYQYEGAWHVMWTEPIDTRARLLEDWTTWLVDRSDPVKRSKLVYPIAAHATRPLGTGPFRAPHPQHPLHTFNMETHGHLLEVDHPSKSTVVHTPTAEARAILRAAAAAMKAKHGGPPPPPPPPAGDVKRAAGGDGEVEVAGGAGTMA